MSGIFGLIHLDRSPVQPAELQAMRSAMQHWGPDGGATWSEGCAGLGNLILFDTPEAHYERAPMKSPQGFVFTAEARLDNRVELCETLHIATSDRSILSDGELALRAYEHWGESSTDHLLGDWSFAAWHPSENRLFLARDHTGTTALYYYQDAHRFAFASSRHALIALGIPRRLNEFYLACVLTSWQAHYGSQTVELDLHRLPPAHTLRLQGADVVLARYWRTDDIPELRLRDPREYVDAYLPIYDRAVRDRLRATRGIGTTLSGGLDSGSVALLAARALRENGRRLKAYTAAPLHDVSDLATRNWFGDESEMARATAASAENIDHVELRAEHVSPIDSLRRSLAIHAEPVHGVPNAYWIMELEAAAQRDGLGVLLTGQAGNATISWHGVSHARLLRTRLRERRFGRALQFLVYPRLPVSFLRLLRRFLHPAGLNWSNSAIHPGFAKRLGLSSMYIRGSGSITNPELWHSPGLQRQALLQRALALTGATWMEEAAAHNLDIRDPTCDRRVLEFGLSIPNHHFLGPDGSNRWIIRTAMQGIMPDQVRLNPSSGRQAADLAQRFADSAPEVEDTLALLERSTMAAEYVSISRLREVWRSIQVGVNRLNAHEAISILARGIAAGLYLRDLENSG
jgi:asparagine synthase (glutamine-hydrolysing)